MISFPRMSGYIPSGSQNRPSVPHVENEILVQRITECGEAREIWEWTRKISPGYCAWIRSGFPEDCTLRPQFHVLPPRRQREILWIIAHMVWYRIQESRIPSSQEYLDFLHRARWKSYQDTGSVNKVENYQSSKRPKPISLRGARETSLQ
jgi:hypothetical protein